MSIAELARDLNVCQASIHNLEYNKGHRFFRRILKYCRDHHIAPETFYPPDD